MVPPCSSSSMALLQAAKCLRSFRFQNGFYRYGAANFSTNSVLFAQPTPTLDSPDKGSKGGEVKNTSFVTNMFRGVTHTEQVFPYPDVLSAEQKETLESLVDPFNKFMEECNNPTKNDADMKVQPDTMKGLCEMGAFGLQVPTELSGLGLSNTQYARITEVIGAHDLGVGITVGAHQSIGFKGILLFGNDEQKKKYLPDLATGRKFAAFVLTEPTSGSDAASIRTHAEPSPDGKGWILNGNKLWISNGGFADVMTVFAQTPVKDEKTGQTKTKMSAFIVERKFGGVSSGPPEKKMGIKASNTTEVYFDNTPVPNENVLLKPGDGFKIAMNILNNGRFGMGAAMSGTMRWAIAKAVDFAVNRTQFNKKIMEFGVIQEKLANMAMRHYACESMAYIVAGSMDRKFTDYHLEAAISKCFASEAATFVVDEAIQIMGGMGFMKETQLERVMRDLRIFRIFEGTNDILRLMVALTGAAYAGGSLAKLQQALKHPLKNFGMILSEATKRTVGSIGAASNEIGPLVHPSLQNEARVLAEIIDDFGKNIEQILVKYGKKIAEEQCVMTRVAECAMDMFSMAAVLSRATQAHTKKLPSAKHQELMAQAWCYDAALRVRFNMGKTKGEEVVAHYGRVKEIAKNLCKEGGVCHPNPVGF